MRDCVQFVGLFTTIVFPIFLAAPAFAGYVLPVPTRRLFDVLRICYVVSILSLWAFVVLADAYLLDNRTALSWAVSIFITLSTALITWALYHLAHLIAEWILYRFFMLNRDAWLG